MATKQSTRAAPKAHVPRSTKRPLDPTTVPPRSISMELDGTVGAMFAYVASMRPIRGLADVECNDEYQRGRSLIQRLGISATGDEMPSLALSPRDCADILHFMYYSEPVEAAGWWKDPEHGPSHLVGMYVILQAMERAMVAHEEGSGVAPMSASSQPPGDARKGGAK